jgi:hypothetical protein
VVLAEKPLMAGAAWDYARLTARLFHVSSAANRESILAHGLDWTRMGAARGIAGSTSPEQEGVFLCLDEFEAGFFVQINNTGGPVDVWMVTGIEADELVDGGSGFGYFPSPIPPAQVTLADRPQDEALPATRLSAAKGTLRDEG